jgi:protein-tyrosine phosphatase
MSARGRAPAPERGVARLIGRVLRHPAVLPIKRRLIDAAWRWRGRGLVNPPLPAGPIRQVLFLCQGNICRSPFAALRAQQLLDAAGASGIRCLSGGLKASQSPISPPDAVAAASAYGVALGRHAAADTTPEQLAAADVIVVMEVAHVERLRRRAPACADRIHLLALDDPDRSRYGGRERVNLLDPFGHDTDAFVHCYRRIDAALHVFAAAVAARTRPPA